MKLTHENYEQISVLAVRGDLTADQTEALRQCVADRLGEQVRDFVVDLGGVEYVDSQGLEALLWLQERAGEGLGQVRLAALGANVGKVMELTRLSTRFDIHTGVDSAIKSLR